MGTVFTPWSMVFITLWLAIMLVKLPPALSNISLELSNVSGFSGIASAERPIILKPLPLYSFASSERSPISCRQLGQVRVQIFTIVMRFLLNRLLPVLLPSSVVVSKLMALELLSYERDCFV